MTAYVYNDDLIVTDTIKVYADGLFMGDAPQTQFSLFADILIMNTVTVSAFWVYYDDFYADFNPNNRTNPEDTQQPYRMPSYNSLDLYLNCPFSIQKVNFSADLGCQNVVNSGYIIRGQDGPTHTISDFTGFWGFGRTIFAGLKMRF